MAQSDHKIWEQSYSEGVAWDIAIPNIPVYEFLDKTAQDFGTAPAFNFLDKQYLWSEIHEQATKFAKGLQENGLKKGDKIGLFLPNCPLFVIAYYGILKAGGTVVNFNPLYAKEEVKHQINDSGVRFMVTADLKLLFDALKPMLDETEALEKIIVADFAAMLPFPKNTLFKVFKAAERRPVKAGNDILLYEDLLNNDGKPSGIKIDADKDIAVIQYTGGTTGVPKGAMLSHKNVVANVYQIDHWLVNSKPGEEKMMGVLPFFHVFAMTAIMNLSVKNAMEIISMPRFDLDETLRLIDKYKPTLFPAVPAIYTAINNHKKQSYYNLSSIRYCISGGAPLPVEVKQNFEKITGCTLIEGYGLTETAPVVSANPLIGKNAEGSIGLPLPMTDIKLIDPETQKPAKLGEKGEICVKGPQVMLGYWNKPGASADSFYDDYLRTGDIATMDEEGYFYIVDRLKDMIITNGYNVYPRHVEEAIYKHPAVEECIVGGLPDKSRGEIVKAWIKPKDGYSLSDDDMKVFLKDHVSKIEIPRQIKIVDEPLPKTMIGKLSRKDVIEQELALLNKD